MSHLNSTGTSGWVVRKVARKFKLRRKTNTVGIFLQEIYLRDDVPCGSAACTQCIQISPPPLPSDASHYLVPDADALLNFWEILGLPHITGVIYLTSVLREVQLRSSQRNWKHLRSLFSDKRRHNLHYDDEHSIFAWIFSKELSKGGIKQVASWFSCHLEGKIPIILLSGSMLSSKKSQGNDSVEDCKSNSSGMITVLDASQYFCQFWSHDTYITDLYNSLVQAQIETDMDNDDTSTIYEVSWGTNNSNNYYKEHISAKAIELGVAAGDLRIGIFHVSKVSPDEAFVRPSNKGEASVLEILIPNRRLQNRALHGDVVAVRVLSARDSEKEKDELLDKESVFGDPQNLQQDDIARFTKNLTLMEENEEVDDDSSVIGSCGIVKGEVVGIVQRVQRDYVACLDESEEAKASVSHSNRQEDLLCVPMDQRIPLVRVTTRQRFRLVGQRFVIRIDGWDLRSRIPRGHVVRILGPIADISAENTALLIENGINISPFNSLSLQEVPENTLEHPWEVPREEIAKRRDLRFSHKTWSVDPPGCRDVDDALSVCLLPDGLMEVGVHIADVSYFLKQDSHLDLEAQTRGTTVYLVGNTYHMLPAILSEDLCSLREGQDRLAVSVIWTVDPGNEFEVLETWFGRTVIRSCFQMSYSQAQAILDGSISSDELNIEGRQQAFSDLREELCYIASFAQIRRGVRESKGALEFSSVELSFEIEQNNEPLSVKAKQNLPTHWIVAEMMIFANSCVANQIYKAFPNAALLRCHRPPKIDNFHLILQLCEAVGVSMDVSSNKAVADSLASLRRNTNPTIESAFRALLIPAMPEAEYITTGDVSEPSGFYHYGLALEFYTHFTSPIRRYADIIVHRMLVASCPAANVGDSTANKTNESFELSRDAIATTEALKEVIEHLNQRHRASKKAQKQCTELHLLKYLEKHSEAQYALVVEIFEKGMFVFVPKYGLRGFVKLKDKNGNIILPLEEDKVASDSDEANNNALGVQEFKLKYESHCISITDLSGNSVHNFKRMQPVWVYLKADGSRARLPTLSIKLLSEKHPAVLAAQAENNCIHLENSIPLEYQGKLLPHAFHKSRSTARSERRKAIHKMADIVASESASHDSAARSSESFYVCDKRMSLYEAMEAIEQPYYNATSVYTDCTITLPSVEASDIDEQTELICGPSSIDAKSRNCFVLSEGQKTLTLRTLWQRNLFRAAVIRSRYLRSTSDNKESKQRRRTLKERQIRQNMHSQGRCVESVSC